MKIKALVPIKEKSERLANKNFLSFGGEPLYRAILNKLQAIELVEEIIINTDSTVIAEDCAKRYSKAFVIERPLHIRGNEVTANTLIAHDLSVVKGEHFLQTHCTNPLLSNETIIKAIRTYFNKLDTYDSLLSVEEVKKRAYFSDGSTINHNNLKLEQTQHLPPIMVENSNLFLFSRTSFANAGNSRVGKAPQLFAMSAIEGIDIDYMEDFLLAELLSKNEKLLKGPIT